MSVSWPNLLYIIYKNNLFAILKFNECCLINIVLISWTLENHKDTWNRHQFILRPGNCSTVSRHKKSETTLGKQLELTNYNSYSRLIEKYYRLPWIMLNYTQNCYNIGRNQSYNPLETRMSLRRHLYHPSVYLFCIGYLALVRNPKTPLLGKVNTVADF